VPSASRGGVLGRRGDKPGDWSALGEGGGRASTDGSLPVTSVETLDDCDARLLLARLTEPLALARAPEVEASCTLRSRCVVGVELTSLGP
jgi:hypothetical protein